MSGCVSACATCVVNRTALERLGIRMGKWDYLMALAGNPNTGKSTVFNALTGLRQHTGNWPGKTTARAEGSYTEGALRYKVVDLPGTYSLDAANNDERITAEFIREARPDVCVVVMDATAVERNLLLLLQVCALTQKVVVALNLVDEARATGVEVDADGLQRALGVPVVPMAARWGKGLPELRVTAARVAADESLSAWTGAELPPTETLYDRANALVATHVRHVAPKAHIRWREGLDWLLTSPWTAYPLMALVLATVLWLTIQGANVPSSMLASLLVDTLHPLLHSAASTVLPGWLTGLLVDGCYLAAAWVISVMLPPMAIFFPLFTLLEDLGYLPRVAFNLDGVLSRCGAHGKQSLTMAMGFGCNAAGVVATRIIESPRERLVAILTNNFALCNGRWPTQILVATVFIGAAVPAAWSGIAATGAVMAIALLGVALTFGSSWLLSRTLLKGEPSSFTLEIPPLRRPKVMQVLYTSLIDRTLFVLWRAVVFAVPAGAVIWGVSNTDIGSHSLAWWTIEGLDPIAWYLGLNGVILLAYIVAIPANEIVIPTVLMLTVMMTGYPVDGSAGAGVMFETDQTSSLRELLDAGGWTTLTAICLMLFSLCHNPCSTTLYTIYKETGSKKWTAWAAILPLAAGVVICTMVAMTWRAVA